MDKHKIVTVIAIIAIIVPFAYSAMNIYAAEQLKYNWDKPEDFAFFDVLNGGNVQLCNTVPYYVNFKNFQITVIYDEKNRGEFSVKDIGINGLQSKIMKGKFSADDFLESQHLFMTMDFQFDGGDMRVDPSKLFVIVSIDTPIIGIIPYTTTNQYSGIEFDQLMMQDFQC